MEPHTWTDEEIIDLMATEARAYRVDQQQKGKPILYQEMMECVLLKLKEHGLIEDTP